MNHAITILKAESERLRQQLISLCMARKGEEWKDEALSLVSEIADLDEVLGVLTEERDARDWRAGDEWGEQPDAVDAACPHCMSPRP